VQALSIDLHFERHVPLQASSTRLLWSRRQQNRLVDPFTVISVMGARVNSSKKNNVLVKGAGTKPMLFAHGFGCDQGVWRDVTPAFEADHQVVLFDNVGAGGSDLSAYSHTKYGTLGGYADDILDICRELEFAERLKAWSGCRRCRGEPCPRSRWDSRCSDPRSDPRPPAARALAAPAPENRRSCPVQ
jgi:hypothetical protein